MEKAKNSIRERAKRVAPEIKLMVTRSREIATNILSVLEKQGKSQKDLADALNKKESEISRWLQGTHNFTIKTISKIETVLGESILMTSDCAIQYIYVLHQHDNLEQTLSIKTNSQMGYTSFEDGVQYSINSSTIVENTKLGIPECSLN